MTVTTSYEIENPADFKEAVERLGGECLHLPIFDYKRTIVIVDQEEWETPNEDVDHDEDNPADTDPSPFPDDPHNIE